ncbi:TetR/AcrR family transcriptional regulator [Corynebacterium testudinoris]|uniref:Transcriptional regulator, TetR family n=1 Tax=Corynebacterium testudinoris TaxID=136857 RepID=A0A0G3HFM7_9CORY|nr:TetR/AcrR family transcriptional regulator [Corynebacterium testudinoris]AKK09967.1 transcriptional regulator, TetR family [Corynebacterium testudinoris]
MPLSGNSGGRGRPGYGREDVIRIAVEVFNQHGYEATSMGTLAARLGLSKSAIYHHITSKEEILVEATDKALAELTTVIESATQEAGSTVEKLELLVAGSTRVLCEYPAYVRLLLRLRGNTDVELQILERRRRLTQELIDVVRDAQEKGLVNDALEAGVIGRLIFGMINSIVEWYRPGGKYTPEEMAAITPRLVFDGILIREG